MASLSSLRSLHTAIGLHDVLSRRVALRSAFRSAALPFVSTVPVGQSPADVRSGYVEAVGWRWSLGRGFRILVVGLVVSGLLAPSGETSARAWAPGTLQTAWVFSDPC